MARGQDPQTVKGGSLSPYVQQSLQAGKGQAENRLLGAMSEAGATSRTRIQEGGATDRTAMQLQGNKAMQAAELENRDKQAAEMERGRREDNQFRQMLASNEQAFRTELQNDDQEFQNARDSQDYDREKEILDRAEDRALIMDRINAEAANASIGMTLRIAKFNHNTGQAKEKTKTSILELGEKSAKDKQKYDQIREDSHTSILASGDLRKPVGGVQYVEPKEPWTKGRKILSGFGTVGVSAGKALWPDKKSTLMGSAPNILNVVQKELRTSGCKIQAADLLGPGVDALSQKIAKGEVSIEDVRSAAGVLDGAMDAFSEKAEDLSEGTDKAFYTRSANDARKSRRAIAKLIGNTTKIGEGEGAQTVGFLVKSALDSIDGKDLGSRFNIIKQAQADSDVSYEQFWSELEGSTIQSNPIDITTIPGLKRPEAAMAFIDGLNKNREIFSQGSPIGGD